MAERKVWHPASYDDHDIRAIQSLVLYAQGAERPWPPGEEPPPPTPADVKRALDWIIHQAAQTYDEPFTPGQPDATAYALGRRSVGLQIIKLSRLKAESFKARG